MADFKEKKQFLREQVPAMLKQLDEQSRPLWGIMTAQHMIEHLVGSWMVSNGRAQAKCVTPAEKLPAYRAFLYGPEPFQRLARSPLLPEGELADLRKPSLEAAVQQLLEEMERFFSFFEVHPEASFMHPVFGELDEEGWVLFQHKHMGHHFSQFGLTA